MNLDLDKLLSSYLEDLSSNGKLDRLAKNDLVEAAEEVYDDEILASNIKNGATDEYSAAIARAQMYEESAQDIAKLMEAE